MVHKLLEQAREQQLLAQWHETRQQAQEAVQQDNITAIERIECYALAANASLHLGDKDAAQQLLLICEQEQSTLPAEHVLYHEIQALKAVLDEATPQGQMWLAKHMLRLDNIYSIGKDVLRENSLRMQKAAEQILLSTTASVEQRCEAGYYLAWCSNMKGRRKHCQHYLQQLEADLQHLPARHHLHEKVKRINVPTLEATPTEKLVAMMRHIYDTHQPKQAIAEAEQVIRMKEATTTHRCLAYVQMVSLYHDQGNVTALELNLARLMQEERQLPPESPLHEIIQDLHQRIANLPLSPITSLLWRGEKLVKQHSWTEVITLIKPILEKEEGTEKERYKAYMQLGLAYKRLQRQEELQNLYNRFEEETKNLPVDHFVHSTMRNLLPRPDKQPSEDPQTVP